MLNLVSDYVTFYHGVAVFKARHGRLRFCFQLVKNELTSLCINLSLFFKKKDYLFMFREMGREGERKGEKHLCASDNK